MKRKTKLQEAKYRTSFYLDIEQLQQVDLKEFLGFVKKKKTQAKQNIQFFCTFLSRSA